MTPLAEDRAVISVEGVFDAQAVQQICELLDGAVRGEVRIDLTRVREFHDVGVALLARALAGRDARTAVVGLHEHHLRLLRYLGLEGPGANLRAGVEL